MSQINLNITDLKSKKRSPILLGLDLAAKIIYFYTKEDILMLMR